MLEFEPLQVYEGAKGHVVLSQDLNLEEDTIIISPDQVDMVCAEMKRIAKTLKEIREEREKDPAFDE